MSFLLSAVSSSALSFQAAASEAASSLSRFDKVMLNPQPLPPREEGGGQAGSVGLVDDWCGSVPLRFPPPPPPPWQIGAQLEGLFKANFF